LIESEVGKVLDGTMGKPASHGCIRLRIEDAKWLYQLPSGTKVLIERKNRRVSAIFLFRLLDFLPSSLVK
jgi:hypothetical protein